MICLEYPCTDRGAGGEGHDAAHRDQEVEDRD